MSLASMTNHSRATSNGLGSYVRTGLLFATASGDLGCKAQVRRTGRQRALSDAKRECRRPGRRGALRPARRPRPSTAPRR